MSARYDLLGQSSATTLPSVILPVERLQRPLWPAFVIALALLLTLLWSGTLVWLVYSTLLSALF
jgi:alpha-D-ribose 1-methylphosphonate 5-triphosphate synthase subunit PhnH